MKHIFRKFKILKKSHKISQNTETPIFERLEPRLLLNADVTGLATTTTTDPTAGTQPDTVIQADALVTTDQLVIATPQTAPYTQNFESGLPTAAQGWEYYSDNQGRIEVTGGRLRMDDSVGDNTFSLNEAILHLNLTGKTGVTLTLDQYSLTDENDALPANFTGHYKGDGIALSVDGVHWVTVTSLTSSFTGQSFSLDTIIAQAKTAAGSTDVSDVRIKFQQYDNYPATGDGREFDNISVTASIAQAVPYTQNFESGLPTTAQGWEYYSDNQGRIEVTGGRLRMDDSVGDNTFSLNEAILHLNLTGKTGVTLTLDQYSLTDENDALPANFTGHYKGDGIALSVDGVHWVTVTSLTSSFTGQSFSLDSIIAQAKTAAGSTDVSDVRIKFQQYDNYPATGDGREFDNISVTASIAQAVPYTQNFESGLPTTAQGWEYYSDNQGRIEVTGGRLRMDDSVGDNTFSLNEAILHLNLTGKTGVTLTLDQYSLTDENDALPANFTGHYKGDGIALSVDGVHWVTVTSLTSSFTGQSFSLDTIIAQAKTAAGSTDVSDVRIKFQQYDNYPATGDGREFDNINVTASNAQAVPYTQNFESGLPTTAQGWEYYSDNQGRIEVTDGRLRMDDSVGDNTFSLNEAILHLNLTGKTGVTLTLDQYSLTDENDALPANFTGHYKGDGIALSVDGVHWVTVTSLTSSFTGQSFSLDSIIAQAKTAAGSTDVSDVRIKFQQYDNYPATGDGREFDNISVTASIAQAVPYTQNFESGLPTTAQGWEYYSDNQGRIEVTGGRLRMDDSVGDNTFSLNEAILHLNLTGKTGVTLTLDQYSLTDENDALPANFTGHYKGDGIALSVDGVHWVTVTSLTSSFTGQSFSLDSIIAQAKTAAGSTDVSDVRIKFQQYDNYPATGDGREFDNISVTAT